MIASLKETINTHEGHDLYLDPVRRCVTVQEPLFWAGNSCISSTPRERDEVEVSIKSVNWRERKGWTNGTWELGRTGLGNGTGRDTFDGLVDCGAGFIG